MQKSKPLSSSALISWGYLTSWALIRSLLFLWINALLYCFLHEASHALAIIGLGGSVESFYLHWSGFWGFVKAKDYALFSPSSRVVIAAAGSIGSFLSCFTLYAFLLESLFPTKGRVSIGGKNRLLRAFHLFELLLSRKTKRIDFYAWLVCITLGYYLHLNRMVYMLFPGISSVLPIFWGNGDGTAIWYEFTSSKRLLSYLFSLGRALNYLGLGALLLGAYSTILKRERRKLT